MSSMDHMKDNFPLVCIYAFYMKKSTIKMWLCDVLIPEFCQKYEQLHNQFYTYIYSNSQYLISK